MTYLQSSLPQQAQRGLLLITFKSSHAKRPGCTREAGSLLRDTASAAWESCCFICPLRDRPSVTSVAPRLGPVQRVQMEMGSRKLTQDIIACQRFVAFLSRFHRRSPLDKSQVDAAFMAVIAAEQYSGLEGTEWNVKKGEIYKITSADFWGGGGGGHRKQRCCCNVKEIELRSN